jgi:rsbT antagonist protein RsbS
MKSAAPANRTVEPAKLLRAFMPVPILKQGTILIATVQAALTDSDTERLRYDLMEHVSRFRAHGIIVDLTAIDIMDSYAARSLRTIAHMTRLRGADTVIVGLQPEVAFAMVQLGLAFDGMHTALDLEEGLALLNRQLDTRKPTNGRDGAG